MLELDVACRGEADPTSGYLIDIKAIDRAVRATVPGLLADAIANEATPASVMPLILERISAALNTPVESVVLRLSPFHSIEAPGMTESTCTVRHAFDFAASHRLCVPDWTEARNRQQFGKCANANGHGHNYRLEVAVDSPTGTTGLDLSGLERAVQDAVIARFDHKHLNLDTAEFSDDGGVIPSVENIARVCFELLEAPVSALAGGVRLRSVRVWETDRTSCEYPAP